MMQCLGFPGSERCSQPSIPGTTRCPEHTIKKIDHRLDSPLTDYEYNKAIEEGVKHDNGKLPFHLLPVVPLTDIVQVLQHGAEKYGARNWEKGISWSRVYRATLGHLFAWWKGEDLDPDSGSPHLAHAACNILFLLEYQHTHRELDDRPKNQYFKKP